ncbi:MAG: hypothetical protein Q9184_002783 [Pyrenodesmia sp. 2 TL-2023]
MSRLTASVSTLLLGPVLLAAIAAVPAAAYPDPRASNKDSKNNTFDYILVGGGTAGLALANRLAEGSTHSVAVIEAGGFYEQDNGNVSVVPAYCMVNAGTDSTDFNPLVDWGFVTEPQKALGGRRLHYTRGKTLGGTSARNWMYYQRPNAGSLDKWADIAGDDSYTFDKLLPFFKKSVQYTPPVVLSPNSTNDQDPGAWSSAGGPLQLSHGKYLDPFGTWVQPAAVKLGMASINGFQSGNLLGSAYVPFTVDPVKSQRSSSESSFLQSLPPKARLQVYHHTLAERVLLNMRNRATGVRVSSNGTSFSLNARKEVILSAGVFQSPQLLMLSGIGPAATLAKHNISVRINMPGVGSNLQDHAFFGTQRRVLVSTASAQLNNVSVSTEVRTAYNDLATGPLTIPAAGFLAYEKVPPHLRKNLSSSTCHALDTSFSPDWPDIEHLPVGAALGYQRNYPNEDPVDGYNYASIASLLGTPFSRGTVSISSSNPADPPLIDPNYLSHPADVELAIAAVWRQREFWAQMKDLTIGKETLPGENVTSDADILEYIKQSIGIAPHAVGTCRMGRKSDTGSVVDGVGRVYGAQRLRVVDASVIPLLPPGHIQATVYAVAEKIADAILRGL